MLGDYLRAQAEKPFGLDGCCTFLADWCVALGHPDPMAFIRGSYASEEEVAALLAKPGLLRLADRGFASIGLKRTKAPVNGDVAIIARPTTDGTDVAGAIRSTDRWVSRFEHGLLADDAQATRLLRAWSTAR